MSKQIYPAVFHHDEDGYWVEFPDLPGCFTDGDTLEETMSMAADALSLYLSSAKEDGKTVPPPSDPADVTFEGRGFVSPVAYDEAAYLRRTDTRAVKKTLTIPGWLDTLAKEHNLNFSNLLQNAIRRELHLEHA